MWRLVIALIALIAGASCLIGSSNVPSAYAKPVQQAYEGEGIRDLRVDIPVDGLYEVDLQVGRNPGESVPQPPDFPLKVTVMKDGLRIGSARRGGGWSGGSAGFKCYDFKAVKGDVVSISVEPASSFDLYRDRSRQLVVARIPHDYAMYMIRTDGMRLLGILCLAYSAILVIGRFLNASRSRRQNSESSAS
jgi:hypothetical protein